MSFPTIWSLARLRHKLAQGPLPAADLAVYLGMVLVSTSLGGLIPETSEAPSPYDWIYVYNWFSVGIIVLGTLAAYFANGGPGGKDFAPRAVSVLAVVGLRFVLLAFIPTAFAMAVLTHYFPSEFFEAALLFSSNVVLQTLYFAFVAHQLRQVARYAPAA